MKVKAKKLNKGQPVRVRMAPSPTGPFHIGSARTAFFNYLFARKNHGQFIVRIEDTDKERSKPEWEENIKESLAFLGLDYDEGPDKEGPFGPYRQSQRTVIYRKYLENLLASGHAYYCFCSAQDLEAYKQERISRGKPAIYSGQCRGVSDKEAQERIRAGQSCVIRLKTPAKQVVFDDLLIGKIKYNSADFGDTVIAKDIETPLYNLACVIDDFEMQITDVIRGEEHISNTPRQVLIAQALGIEPPSYLHLPLILNQQRAKLSKRDTNIAAKVSDYKENGYLQEALINFLAFLGWNPGDDREIFSKEELINEFSIERLQKAGAVFNVQKLDWLNGYYIRKMSIRDLTNKCIPFLIKADLVTPLWGRSQAVPLVYDSDFTILEYESNSSKERFSFGQISNIVALYQERLKRLGEIPELVDSFFVKDLDYPKELLKWRQSEWQEMPAILGQLIQLLQALKPEDWTEERLEQAIMPQAEQTGDRGKLLWPLRVALSGKQASAGPFEIAAVLGPEKTILRLKQAQTKLL